jgi:predicted DCC family thiol-disulfide oxidoreductase YuxK
VSETRERGPIILFDGLCNLCHGAVRFVIERDRVAEFSFAPFDSATGRRLLEEAFGDAVPSDSVVLFEDGKAHVRSEAAIRILQRLGVSGPLFKLLRIVPRSLRDGVYDLVARNRYRWFGKKQSCPMPDDGTRDRFLA